MIKDDIDKLKDFIKVTSKTYAGAGLTNAFKQVLKREVSDDDCIQVVYQLRKGGKFEVDKFDGVGWVAKPVGLWKRNPLYEKLLLIVIGAMLALIANLYISKSAKQSQRLIDRQQDSLIRDASLSISSLENRIDTLK